MFSRFFSCCLVVVAIGCTVSRAADVEPLKPLALANLNTEKDDDDPHVASSGLQFYYTSQADGGCNVMMSQRRVGNQPWPAGKPLVDLEGKPDCRSVFVTRDGRFPQRLYFATNKDPEKDDQKGDNFDIYFLLKQGPKQDFTTPTPVHTACTSADEMHPWLTEDGLQLFFSRKLKKEWRLFVVKRKTVKEQFGDAATVGFPPGFHHATVTPDGRTMYLQGPLEKDRWGLFRSSLMAGKWTEPEPLVQLNSDGGPKGDLSPNLSRDGTFLYFASDRPGGKGGLDLYAIPTVQLGKK